MQMCFGWRRKWIIKLVEAVGYLEGRLKVGSDGVVDGFTGVNIGGGLVVEMTIRQKEVSNKVFIVREALTQVQKAIGIVAVVVLNGFNL